MVFRCVKGDRFCNVVRAIAIKIEEDVIIIAKFNNKIMSETVTVLFDGKVLLPEKPSGINDQIAIIINEKGIWEFIE